jgi:hypothetical protein
VCNAGNEAASPADMAQQQAISSTIIQVSPAAMALCMLHVLRHGWEQAAAVGRTSQLAICAMCLVIPFALNPVFLLCDVRGCVSPHAGAPLVVVVRRRH